MLGTDRAGEQVPLRDKLRPLYAFVVLMMETFALGALVSDEVSTRTVSAVLATPARVGDFLAGKALIGTTLAFSEAVLIMVLIRAFGEQPLMLAVTLLLGAVLVTGIALIVGSWGQDFIGMIFLAMAFMIPLMIPAFAELFPGTASPWLKAMPTYPLVQSIVGATSGEATWSDVAGELALLALWCAVALGAGMLVLRRKVATL
jgi:ABC-2 type transport system permease protein